MYLIDQEIANEIAAMEKLLYPITQELFKADEEEAGEIEERLREKIIAETQSKNVGRAVMMFLPLLLENRAITSYLRKKKQPRLRSMMPEVTTAEETVYLAMREIMSMTKEEAKQTMIILTRYQRDPIAPTEI